MVDQVEVAVMGVGSLRAAPPVLASLATYFGERPLSLRLYDSDAERLDLFDRFLRTACIFAESEPPLLSTEDPLEALDGAHRVILMVGANCARKQFKAKHEEFSRDELLARWIEEVLVPNLPEDANVLNLMRDCPSLASIANVETLDWPAPLSEDERMRMPHQVLRWARSTESMAGYLEEQAQSPIKAWLNKDLGAPTSKEK